MSVTKFGPCREKTCRPCFRPGRVKTKAAQQQRPARSFKSRMWRVQLSYFPESEYQRHRSACASAQADLCLCCLHATVRFSRDAALIITACSCHLICIGLPLICVGIFNGIMLYHENSMILNAKCHLKLNSAPTDFQISRSFKPANGSAVAQW